MGQELFICSPSTTVTPDYISCLFLSPSGDSPFFKFFFDFLISFVFVIFVFYLFFYFAPPLTVIAAVSMIVIIVISGYFWGFFD